MKQRQFVPMLDKLEARISLSTLISAIDDVPPPDPEPDPGPFPWPPRKYDYRTLDKQ